MMYRCRSGYMPLSALAYHWAEQLRVSRDGGTLVWPLRDQESFLDYGEVDSLAIPNGRWLTHQGT
jgi:hypothetical protein